MSPAGFDWSGLVSRDGDELFDHYRHTLEALGKEKGMLGLIFNKSQNKFQNPARLRRLIVDLIGRENWSIMNADVKGDAYEGLLEKKRSGYEIRGRPVFYTQAFDRGDCGSYTVLPMMNLCRLRVLFSFQARRICWQ